MAIIKANNQTISAITSLPAAISTGKVLQVVSHENSYNQNTNGTSYTDVLSASSTTAHWPTTSAT